VINEVTRQPLFSEVRMHRKVMDAAASAIMTRQYGTHDFP